MGNFESLIDILIKDEMEGRPHHERVLDLGKTPALLIQTAGFPDIPLAIKASVVSKSAFDHGISTSFLKRLPAIVRNPVIIPFLMDVRSRRLRC